MPKEQSSIIRLSFKVVSRRFPAALFHGIVLGGCCAGLRSCCCEAPSFQSPSEAHQRESVMPMPAPIFLHGGSRGYCEAEKWAIQS